LTAGYEPELQKEIRDANSECLKADEETQDWRRIMRFSECFYQNEKKVSLQ